MINKVIIAGGRDFNNYELLRNTINSLNINISEIISGTANGADSLGEKYANEYNIKIAQFKPDWSLYGKAAGHVRNRDMAEYGNILIAFWDGKSPGTKSMIKYAKHLNLVVYEIRY